MFSVVRHGEEREPSHSCTGPLPHFLPKESEPSLLVEEQDLRVQGSPSRVCVHSRLDCTTRIFLHFHTFRDIFGCVRCPEYSHFFCQCLLEEVGMDEK